MRSLRWYKLRLLDEVAGGLNTPFHKTLSQDVGGVLV
jgi:hypothetical protein